MPWVLPRGRSTPGRQFRYSALASEFVLTLRPVLHLALRRAGAFSRGGARYMNQGCVRTNPAGT